ncbi:hypothetical protein NOK12_26190 [Nocardioides sp. OK12]|nr:hypothetical protein [Nocardioides sp. OK12]GHJ60101.1 hypothetical protein NOK12_26190 [Nocardioides sp. OK12]
MVYGNDLAPEVAESVYGPAVSAGRLVQVRRVLDLSTSQVIQRVRDRDH